MKTLTGERSRDWFGASASPAVAARAWLAEYLAELGEFEEAIAHKQRGEQAYASQLLGEISVQRDPPT